MDQDEFSSPQTQELETVKRYNYIRKPFRIPSEWKKPENPLNLILNGTYDYNNPSDALTIIKGALNKLAYDKDNKRWLHDYIHFYICDLLIKYGIGFITEQDILKNEKSDDWKPLIKVLTNHDGNIVTPDLILKEKIFDIKTNPCPQIEKSKYQFVRHRLKNYSVCILNPNSDQFANNFKKLFEDKVLNDDELESERNSFMYNLEIFKLESNYWLTCIKENRIICNDVDYENLDLTLDQKQDHNNKKVLLIEILMSDCKNLDKRD